MTSLWQPTMGLLFRCRQIMGKNYMELKIDPTVEAVNGNVFLYRRRMVHITGPLLTKGPYMLGEEGVIYFRYAFQGTSGPPKDAPWPMFQQNRRNSGNAYDEESQSSKDQPILKWTYETGGVNQRTTCN